MSKATLNEITDLLLGMLLVIDDNDGEVDDDIFLELEQIESDFELKVERIAGVIESFKAKAAAEKIRAAKVLDHSKALTRKAGRLEAWLLDNMSRLKMGQVKAGDYTVTARKKPVSVGLAMNFDGGELYTRVKVTETKSPDKTAIKEALKAGKNIEGAWLEENNKRLEIK